MSAATAGIAPWRAAAGITLLETLLAMSLIGVGVMAVAPLLLYAIQHNAVGADLGRAGGLAVERLEQLRSQPVTRLAAGGDLDSDVSGFFDASDPDFLVRWSVTPISTPTRSGTLRVRVLARRVTVGAQKRVDLTLLRAR